MFTNTWCKCCMDVYVHCSLSSYQCITRMLSVIDSKLTDIEPVLELVYMFVKPFNHDFVLVIPGDVSCHKYLLLLLNAALVNNAKTMQ